MLLSSMLSRAPALSLSRGSLSMAARPVVARALMCAPGCDAIVADLAAIVADHQRSPLGAAELHARLRDATARSGAEAARAAGGDAGSMRVAELRDALGALGLSGAGNKAELQDRLREALAAPPAEAAAAAAAATTTTTAPKPAAPTSLRAELERVAREHAGVGPQSGIFCDGSCNPNPGPGGWGVVEVSDGSVVWSDRGREGSTTNNRMELSALIAALGRVPAGGAATVYSDSNLCVRTLNEWAERWEANGWKRAKGERVENEDLVREALALRRARPAVDIRWIRAHEGATWNEYADRLAGHRE